MALVLVTGATGFIGSHVARALVGRGERVRCLVRPGGNRAALDGLPVELVAGDLTRPDTLPPAVDGAQAVFHCAADYRFGAHHAAVVFRTNVDGTEALLSAAAKAGVGRVVYTSSVGALAGGTRPDSPADEASLPDPEELVGAYKQSKFRAERIAEDWNRRGLPVVIVNPSTPIGEWDAKPTPTGQMVVDFLRGRIRAYVDGGLNVVDVRDVAQGHLLAETRGKPGERYILGSRNVTFRELFGMLGRASGMEAPRIRVPRWLPLLAAHAEMALAHLGAREPRLTPEAVRLSALPMYFDAGRAVRELGLPQSPVEGAIARAVAWYRHRGYAP
ncbi:MAG: NAD-dependent epimerase/dehydratase family protein [Gemmatimonadota bacterium]